MEGTVADPARGGKMCARGTAEGAAGVGNERESRGFDWHGFFRNPKVMVQAFLSAILFYITTRSPRETGLFLVFYLLFVPMSVLNLMGTHLLNELVAKRVKKA